MPPVFTLCYLADATNIHVQRWLGYFVQRGYRVYCLSERAGQMDGVTVIPLPGREEGSKTQVLRARTRVIRQRLKEIQPQVVHALSLYPSGWAAALTGFHPVVMSLMGPDFYLSEQHYRHPLHHWRDQWLNRLALQQSNLITTVSDDLNRAASHVTHGMMPVELVPIGVDVSLFHPDCDAQALRVQLQIPDEAFVVLSPRQMTPHYNQDQIIEAIPRVLEEVPHAIFIMKDTFGHTPERQAYVESLKVLADSLGVSKVIRWVDEVPLSELPLYYGLADVVVSVPTTDGMPVTIFEAMACQKPLVVGDLPSYNEVILQGQTGLRVPIQNSQVLARAIIKIHKNPALARRMVEESQVVLHQYGMFQEQMMRMERYYQGLVQKAIPQRCWLKRWWSGLLFRLLVAWT